MEETMLKSAAAATMLLSFPPSHRPALSIVHRRDKRQKANGMNCKVLKPENRAENQPNMPPTSMKDTVIPKSGATQDPGGHFNNRRE
jgi:hypothetical protein